MGRRDKSKGFNNPFAALKSVAPAAPPPSTPIAAPPSKLPEPTTDAQLFLQATHGTARLDGRGRLPAPVREPPPRSSDDELALAELTELVGGRGQFRVHESEEVHTGMAPGVSFQLLERLQRGDFAYHRHLDLHGYNRDAAHTEVIRFVATARRDNERCVLVITGRGKSSPGGTSVLREAMPRWLCRAPLRPHVLAFCTARAIDGGPGAFYVLLRRAGVPPYGV